MVEIGKYNRLRIAKERSVGYFFDGGEDGDILMPKRHQPDEGCEVGDEMDVFVFLDAEERLTATVRKPFAQVGELAWLKVVDVHRVGAFLDWGMTKDLMVPHREQAEEMVIGESYLVKILLDADDRIIGTTRLDEHISEFADDSFKKGQEVEILIGEHTELGYKVVVNNAYWGLLYDQGRFKKVRSGEKTKAYISKVREDRKLDISLQKPGYHQEQVLDIGEQILHYLADQGGWMELTDKSSPEEIKKTFEISKKTFKQVIGRLYKERLIALEPDGIRLLGRKPGSKSESR